MGRASGNTKGHSKLGIVRSRNNRGKRNQGIARMTNMHALKLLERRYGVWKLRKDGYSVRDIAATLNCGEAQVRSDIVIIGQRMAKEIGESVEESRFLQIERLDALLKKYQPLAEGGNLGAASMVLSIEARRSKLLALDMPEQKKLDITGIREYVGINVDDV